MSGTSGGAAPPPIPYSLAPIWSAPLRVYPGAAACIVTRSKFDENAEPLIKELGWKTAGNLSGMTQP